MDNDDHNVQTVWNLPIEGWTKCNVDADFNRKIGTTNRG